MTIPLRDYQQECLETVLKEYQEGIKRQLLSLPTGAGKTVVMSAVAKTVNKKTLVLAHREELITQAVEKFRIFWPEVSIGVCMAERDEIDTQVVVGSVQSVSRPKRLERLMSQGFDVMMIDEAHHAVSDSYQSVINALEFSEGTKKLLIGVTATPNRSDSQTLGATFDKITFSRSIGTLIKAGYLSPVIGRKILTSFVLERIRTQNGDFAIGDLAEAVNTPERNAFIIEKFKEYAPNRKGVAFCCDVQHCKDLAEAFNKQGVKAAPVWGDMPKDERKRTLEDLKAGKIQIATSCGVLTEGFDEPSIDCVIMARPTKSATLYIQSVGRGLRLWPGKENCLVLDFSDRGHSLDSVLSLKSAIPEASLIQESKEESTNDEEVDRSSKIEVLQEIDREFDILGSVRFLWVQVGDEWSLQDDERHEIVMSPKDEGFIATLYQPDGKSSTIVKSPLPLGYCSGVCEDYARRNLKVAFADPKASWMNYETSPTQGQIKYLEKQNIDCSNMNRGKAAMTIRQIIANKNKQRRLMANEPITLKQKYLLDKYGFNTANMSKLQAMQTISRIKQSPKAVNY